MKSSVDRIRQAVRNHVKNNAPGLYHTLDLLCIKLSGKDCIHLLLENPALFKETIVKIYDSPASLKVVLRIYMYPLTMELNTNKSIDEIIDLLINNPREFAELIYGCLGRSMHSHRST